MSLGLATVNENARSALDCGGSTPPWNKAGGEDQGGVEPPQSKAPSATLILMTARDSSLRKLHALQLTSRLED